MDNKVFIIAEAGDNHNGDVSLAYKLVDAAIEAGADAVKFQTFITEELVCKSAEMADYQKKNTGVNETQFEMIKKLELTYDEFRSLRDYCKEKGIKFMTTAFDLTSVDFIVNDLKVDVLKLPSGEITNYPYLVKSAKTGLPIILSTGMCNLEEIEEAVKVLKDNGTTDLTLLHCTTEYPTPLDSVNLLAIKTMQEKFGLKVGYSDHTQGIEVSLLAVALGATVIEKHFTLDKNMPGPDHKASLEPNELKDLVDGIRRTTIIMGDGNKVAQEAEKKNIAIARKSIVAKTNIKKGETLTEENLTCKRPGTGISPMKWNEIIGTVAVKDYIKDEII